MRKTKFEKLAVNAEKGGQIHYETAYDAPDAARRATRLSRRGWRVEVKTWKGGAILMKCLPAKKHDKSYAHCEIKPSFKKRIRLR